MKFGFWVCPPGVRFFCFLSFFLFFFLFLSFFVFCFVFFEVEFGREGCLLPPLPKPKLIGGILDTRGLESYCRAQPTLTQCANGAPNPRVSPRVSTFRRRQTLHRRVKQESDLGSSTAQVSSSRQMKPEESVCVSNIPVGNCNTFCMMMVVAAACVSLEGGAQLVATAFGQT